MGKGYLKIQTVTAGGAFFVPNVSITITDENYNQLYNFNTDQNGNAREISLEAPDIWHNEDPNAPGPRYFKYNAAARTQGYRPVDYEGVMIFDTSTTLQPIVLEPLVQGDSPQGVQHIDVSGHALDNPVEPAPQIELSELKALPEVFIPNFVTVHLGKPDEPAPNIRVPFKEYIKNVTAHEIYDNWPETTITANIYCIVSITLNRIYTKFYISQGTRYNFDITSDPSFDQKFVLGGGYGARINEIVNSIFNNYLAIAGAGHREPFLALFCDGETVAIPGRLFQWGSFFDGVNGMTAWQIVTKYFNEDLELRESKTYSDVIEAFPGVLREGNRGNNVRTLQKFLNKIFNRYVNVPINEVNGIFGPYTENAVTKFQSIARLAPTGEIDRATWYEISRIYAFERGLLEMYDQAQRAGFGQTPQTTVIQAGDTGALVTELQFLLNFISIFYNEIPFIAETSRFDTDTENGVKAFEQLFNLTEDGVVGAAVWRKLYDVYRGLVENFVVPPLPGFQPLPAIPAYPGIAIGSGNMGLDVMLIQQAINRLADFHDNLWKIPDDGIFGSETRIAVQAVQRLFGLTEDGIVGLATWNSLMQEYFSNIPPGSPTAPPYPGEPIEYGDSGLNVVFIQEALNRLAGYLGGAWIIEVDGNFLEETREAVIGFQQMFGLSTDGIVGPTTWNRLMEEYISSFAKLPPSPTPAEHIPAWPGATIGYGSTGNNVRLIQEAINMLAGHNSRLWELDVDGAYGPVTRDAVSAFQTMFGLPITGEVNEQTWYSLMQEAYRYSNTRTAYNSGNALRRDHAYMADNYALSGSGFFQNIPMINIPFINNNQIEELTRFLLIKRILVSMIRG